jgi:hypothetical protein
LEEIKDQSLSTSKKIPRTYKFKKLLKNRESMTSTGSCKILVLISIKGGRLNRLKKLSVTQKVSSILPKTLEQLPKNMTMKSSIFLQ